MIDTEHITIEAVRREITPSEVNPLAAELQAASLLAVSLNQPTAKKKCPKQAAALCKTVCKKIHHRLRHVTLGDLDLDQRGMLDMWATAGQEHDVTIFSMLRLP